MSRPARGIMLLEVLAALTIFACAAVVCLSLLAQLDAAELRAATHERRLRDQDRLMTAYAVLARDELDQRLGTRVVGPYLVDVQRPAPALYRVEIGDSSGADLVTLIHRPEPPRAP